MNVPAPCGRGFASMPAFVQHVPRCMSCATWFRERTAAVANAVVEETPEVPDDDGPTIVRIPVSMFAHYEDGVITKFVIVPSESDAGYFGPGSSVWDGPSVDLSHDGPFWTAVSEYLHRAHEYDPDAGFIAHWEE